jgi:hypothetical protein
MHPGRAEAKKFREVINSRFCSKTTFEEKEMFAKTRNQAWQKNLPTGMITLTFLENK